MKTLFRNRLLLLVILFAAGYFAFTWVPMLLRYFGVLPKNTHNQAMQAQATARGEDVPLDEKDLAILQSDVPIPCECQPDQSKPSVVDIKQELFEEDSE